MPVWRRLLLLAVSLLVPAVIACGVAVLFAYTHERERAEENLLRTTQALGQSLDQEFDTIVRQLEVLATSPFRQQGDYQSFWRQAARAVREDGMRIVAVTREGQQVVNTLRPVGDPLPAD